MPNDICKFHDEIPGLSYAEYDYIEERLEHYNDTFESWRRRVICSTLKMKGRRYGWVSLEATRLDFEGDQVEMELRCLRWVNRDWKNRKEDE